MVQITHLMDTFSCECSIELQCEIDDFVGGRKMQHLFECRKRLLEVRTRRSRLPPPPSPPFRTHTSKRRRTRSAAGGEVCRGGSPLARCSRDCHLELCLKRTREKIHPFISLHLAVFQQKYLKVECRADMRLHRSINVVDTRSVPYTL